MPDKEPSLNESMILFAVRHALEGGVFRTAKVTDYLTENWEDISPNTRELIIRDIENYYESSPATTHAAWKDVLNLP
jgi:hypothetical protein